MALTQIGTDLQHKLAIALGNQDAANQIYNALKELAVGTDERATTSGLGAAAGTGSTAVETIPIVHKTVITLTALAVAITDSGGAAGGQGSQKIYDFPEGNIAILGCVSNLAITASGGITATAAVVGSIGTVAAGAGDATLTSTEANIMPSTAASLTASAGTCAGVSTSVAPIDGTTTPIDALLNFAVPDAGISANGTITATGTVTMTWVNLGDK